MNATSHSPTAAAPRTLPLLGTPLLLTDYAALLELLPGLAARGGPTAIDFCNTHILAMRRTDPAFHDAHRAFDYFVPDGMPLIWCLRACGAALPDRVYGPAFLRHALTRETRLRHYFLGGSDLVSQRLVEQARRLGGGRFQVAGAHHGYLGPGENAAVIDEINRLSPDVIWIGLGTPKQQQWVRENKTRLARGVVLTVGFAFDVNAGTKRDAPMWMQRFGLTWLFRLSQEPARLGWRYLRYNSMFVLLLALEALRSPFHRSRPGGAPLFLA